MKRLVIVSIAVVTASLCQRDAARAAQSEPDTAGFVARTYGAGPQTMPYRLFVPKGYDAKLKYPLIVWLHGAGGMGTDNLQQISGDQVPGTRLWVTQKNQAAHPAFVVAPQSRLAWRTGHEDAELQPDSRVVAALIDALSAEFAIDPTRLYLLGQSMGGGAAWNLLTNAPDRFAAVVLVAPALGTIAGAEKVSRVPLWLLHGELDSPERVNPLIAAIRSVGGHPRFTEHSGERHEIWTRAFAEPELVEWLFAQARR